VQGTNNEVAIELISTHIRQQLSGRTARFRARLATEGLEHALSPAVSSQHLWECGDNVTLIPQTTQLKVRLCLPEWRTRVDHETGHIHGPAG
jgi:hypothetical protein